MENLEYQLLEKTLMGGYKITSDENKAALLAFEYSDNLANYLNYLIEKADTIATNNNVARDKADLQEQIADLKAANADLQKQITDLKNINNEQNMAFFKAEEVVKNAEQRFADGERLRESLIRMTRERANKDRHLDLPKKHNGYVLQFVQSQSTISKGNQYQTWQITLETPYLMAAGDVVLNIVLRDLLDHQQTAPALLELMGVRYENKVQSVRELKNNHSRLPDYERHYGDTNYCYNISFKGSAKGYWQVVLSCTKLPALDVFAGTIEDNFID